MSAVEKAGTLTIGGDIEVHRLGFGAMRITGRGTWGPPPDRDVAKAESLNVAAAGAIALYELSRRSL